MKEVVTGDDDRTEVARGAVMSDLRAHFRPEFLNRVDDIVLFKPLTEDEIGRIVELQVADVRSRLTDRRITLELTAGARELIAHSAYDPVYGARPLRRFIQREVETRIGRALLSGDILPGATIVVDAADGELRVRWHNPPDEDDGRFNRARIYSVAGDTMYVLGGVSLAAAIWYTFRDKGAPSTARSDVRAVAVEPLLGPAYAGVGLGVSW